MAAGASRSSFEMGIGRPSAIHAASSGLSRAGSTLKLAGCPNAAEPESLNRQQPLHRAQAGSLASRAPMWSQGSSVSYWQRGRILGHGGRRKGFATISAVIPEAERSAAVRNP
jgi:hypothetical protein